MEAQSSLTLQVRSESERIEKAPLAECLGQTGVKPDEEREGKLRQRTPHVLHVFWGR